MSEEYDKCDECIRFYNSGSTGGWNCSETTLYGLTKILGFDSDLLPKIATPFGGGVGRGGHFCGSLVAGLITLGLEWGRDDMNEERAPAYERAERLIERFLEKYGTLNCREITGIDVKNSPPEGEEKMRVNETICKPLVKQVCRWVTEEFEKEKNI